MDIWLTLARDRVLALKYHALNAPVNDKYISLL